MGEILIDFIKNRYVIVPLAAWIIAQIAKMFINLLVNKELRFERLWGDGGMPSCHSAIVSSLMVTCGLGNGFDSDIFAVSFILAVMLIHDADGVRREAGKQAVTLKKMDNIVNGEIADPDEHIRTEKLKELVGHTPLQVAIGCIFGIAVAIVGHFVFDAISM